MRQLFVRAIAAALLVSLAGVGNAVASISITPGTAQVTGVLNAPYNTWQGDTDASLTGGNSPYYTAAGSTRASQPLLFPTYTPGSNTTTFGGSTQPNLSVYPNASSTTPVSGVYPTPYPSGVVGTPGPLSGFCPVVNASDSSGGAGFPAASLSGLAGPGYDPSFAYATEPAGVDLPMSPYYFPDVVMNPDGTLTGYFDWRPKDGDEAITVATSTDNGLTWTTKGMALEQDPGYCPTVDTNDDGQGHPDVTTIAGKTSLYTLQRAAGDNAGVGLLVHSVNPSASNPLAADPATEQSGIDADTLASAAASVPATGGGTVTIPVSTFGTAGTLNSIVAPGSFDDYSVNGPTSGTVDPITCTGETTVSGQSSLTGCSAKTAATVSSGDELVQVIGTVSTAGQQIPASSAQNPAGSGGLATLAFTTTGTALSTYETYQLNLNAPYRLYIDGHAVYCNQANANPTTKFENCTSPSAFTPAVGDAITSDPITPSTAQMTTGLIAPDGLIGSVPYRSTFNGNSVPSGASIVLYTEKLVNYYFEGQITGTVSGTTYTSNGGAFALAASETINYSPFPSGGEPLPSTGSFPMYVGTGNGIQTLSCSGNHLATESGAPAGSMDVTCSGGSGSTVSKTWIGGPGAAIVPAATLAQIGEGKASAQKLFGNNEDYSVVRAADTTDGVNFSDLGIISGTSVPAAGSAAETGGYTDLSNPNQQYNPSSTAAPTTATMTPSSPADLAIGASDTVELRYIGSRGTIVTNPDGSLTMFLNGAWASDGDSDAFNQVFSSTSTDGGQTWSVPKVLVSTDYSFSASSAQEGTSNPIGVSAYYSGRAYNPTVVQNAGGGVTMLFAGYRIPKTISAAGTVLGTQQTPSGGTPAQWTIGTQDPVMYRNILTDTLTMTTSPRVKPITVLSSSASPAADGSSVTYTATLSGPAAGTTIQPSGTVTFADGATTLCAAAALTIGSADTATCTTNVAAASGASQTITATYSGDTNYAASTASAAELVTATSGAITTSPSPLPQGLISDGGTGTFTSTTLSDPSLCTGGVTCSWSASPLPAGLSLTPSGSTATLSGTPTTVQTTLTTITVTPSSGSAASETVPLSVTEVLSGGIGTFPTGMVSDPANERVYVAATKSSEVDSIDASANPIAAVTAKVPFGSLLNYPEALAFDGTNLFASNFLGGTVDQTTVPAGTAVADTPAGCTNPEGVAEDSGTSDVWVACYGSGNTGSVAVMTVAGTPAGSFPLPGSVTAPSGVAPDGTSGHVVIADAAASKLYTVSASGTVGTAVALPTGATPANVAYASVAGTKYDYVADPGTGEFSVIDETTDASGNDVADVSLPFGAKASEPYGVATNAAGTELVVSDANNARALVYTLSNSAPYATLQYVLNLPATAVPDGVADMLVSGTNLAFVANEYGNTVSVVDPPTASPRAGTAPVIVGAPATDPIGTAVTPPAAAVAGDALAPVPGKVPTKHRGTTLRKHREATRHHHSRRHRRRAQKRRHAHRGHGARR